jgi:hypothetical protein
MKWIVFPVMFVTVATFSSNSQVFVSSCTCTANSVVNDRHCTGGTTYKCAGVSCCDLTCSSVDCLGLQCSSGVNNYKMN